ncbi:MAG: enoyl-CoA hydratase/isomerase family protein [Deltaproteobacteria bacterium]|nr:enoyl-CoA hydratase/isomerase family protein [Deltaproteobacteria bacterium]
MPNFTSLLYEVDGHICTITLNRPEKKNALSQALTNEIIFALETARDDSSVRVIVLTGSGGVFCSGADLGGMADSQKSDIPHRGSFPELLIAQRTCGKPIIAKVRKYALAGGLGLMMGCQFALAEDTAQFSTPEIDRGIWPMMIMANIFRHVPRRKGLEMCLFGERIDAKQAENWGVINKAVPADQLDAEVASWAQRLAEKSPIAMKLGLNAFYKQEAMEFDAAVKYLSGELAKVINTEDAREGIAAFLQKRKPNFKGK